MTEPNRWQMTDSAVESYEQHLVPTIFGPWALDLLSRITLHDGDRVLDLACGTGVVARLAADRVAPSGHVVGIDLNPGMIAGARRAATASGATVGWREGDVTHLPDVDGRFDAVVCQQGLQFLADKPAALGEWHRVLAPGGRLALSVWRALPHNPFVRLLADSLERHLGPVAAAMRAPCAFGDADHLRALCADAGFTNVHVSIAVMAVRHPEPDAFFRGQLAATPLAGTVAALDPRASAAMLDDIHTAFRLYTDDDGLAVPFETHVLTATA